MERTEALDIAEATLHNSGFMVSRRCNSKISCFDFAARKEENIVFVKVLIDIKDISPSDAIGLREAAKCFDCTSLIISDMNGNEKLSDDTLYSRYDVYVVTFKTLDDIVRGTYPMIEATPGGYFVRLDGDEIRARRHDLGLSIGKLAGMVGISRRALYGYERELTRASVSIAYKLTEILGVPLVKTINILRNSQNNHETDENSQQPSYIKNKIHKLIIDKFTQLGFRVTQLRRVPFDFVASCPKTNLRIIGSFLKKKRKDIDSQVEEMTSLGEVIKAKPVFFGISQSNTPINIPFLGLEDLTKLSKIEELTSLL